MATIYLTGGYHKSADDPAEVFNTVPNTRLPVFPDDFYSFGIGISLGDPDLRFGWYAEHLIRRDADVVGDATPITGRLLADRVLVEANYGLFKHRGNQIFVVAPTLGIGIEDVRFSIQESGSVSFEEALQNPLRGIEFRKTNFLLDLALQFDLALKHEPDFTEAGRIITLRFGYMLSPFGFGWRAYSGDLNTGLDDSPDFSLAGPYVRLGFGM